MSFDYLLLTRALLLVKPITRLAIVDPRALAVLSGDKLNVLGALGAAKVPHGLNVLVLCGVVVVYVCVRVCVCVCV